MGLEVGPEVGVEAARRTGEYIVIVIYCYSLFIVNWSECRRFCVVAYFDNWALIGSTFSLLHIV